MGRMKTYRVHFHNKHSALYHAYAYTNKEGKFYFHKKEDKTDFESFAFEKDVMGIEELPPHTGATPILVA